ncbi:dUTP diphosphatase [Candidatus Kaiserbacteria bacterium]|nr:dUTP diphosphatase [Candidatus Kaiserbacteria bacterium]
METVSVKKLSESAVLPERKTAHAAGFDLFSNEGAIIYPCERKAVGTGVAVEMPESIFSEIRPRSGLAVNAGIDVLAGVIDADYRGEIRVVLINHGTEPYRISPGDRIAQLIFRQFVPVTLVAVESLPETARGESGFGSTGE